MKKILWVFLPLVLIIVSSSLPASAHVLIKDDSGTLGAVLHVSPDDNPIAGQPSDLIFDVSDSSQPITKNNYQAQLLVDNKLVDASINESFIVARYTFPAQGVFDLELLLTPQNPTNPAWRFHYIQRVSRGNQLETKLAQTPVWVPPLLTISAAFLLCLLLVAVRRRHQIITYSKMKK